MRSLAIAVGLAAACGSGAPDPEPPARRGPGPDAPRAAPQAEPTVRGTPGLWPVDDARARLSRLADRGARFEPDAVGGLASATVQIGECAGAFVSEDGLVATSLECVRRTLWGRGDSTIEDGFLADARTEELNSGPELVARVLLRSEDVTADVRDGLDGVEGDTARGRHIRARIDELVSECRSEHVDCEIARERGGARFRQLRFLVVPDVRVVYAPPRELAEAGADARGRWPRAAAGAALVRAYVGPTGAPAAPHPTNEPFVPERALTVATGPIAEGEPVAIAGFPERTYRDEPLVAFEQARSWGAPRRARLLESMHEAVHAVLRADPDSAVARRRTRELEARLRRARGVWEGLERGAKRRRDGWEELARELEAAADESGAGRARADVDDFVAAHEERYQTRERDASMRDLDESAFVRAARGILAAARAREGGDEEAAAWAARRLRSDVLAMPEGDHPAVDRAALGAVFARAARWANINRGWLREALGMDRFRRGDVPGALDALYAGTEIGDPAVRRRLFAEATPAALEEADDAFVRLALALESELALTRTRQLRYEGARAAAAPAYHRALAAVRDRPRAPDASGSLRISFGQIHGYRPDPDEGATPAVVRSPGGVAAFLSTADSAGGFAGGPTVNASGEIVGIALEPVHEALGAAWEFDPATSRTIHMHAGHLVELLRDAGADAVLRELGVAEPATP